MGERVGGELYIYIYMQLCQMVKLVGVELLSNCDLRSLASALSLGERGHEERYREKGSFPYAIAHNLSQMFIHFGRALMLVGLSIID